jgi:OmpA-OmpF porin, OOP family
VNTLKLTLLSLVAVAFTGCGSSIKKADISATADPSAEAAKLEEDINSGYAQQFDVLAPDDFKRARERLADAKKEIGTDTKQDKILDDLRYGRAYFNRASYHARSRRPAVEGILAARQEALTAGARKYSSSRKELDKLDEDVQDASGDFAKNFSPKEYSKTQQGYMDIELTAIQNTHLSQADAFINGAIDKRASRYTPKLLVEAQKSLRNAANAIAADRRNPDGFKAAVEKANYDANLLNDVLTTARQGKGLSESAATRIVLANKKVETLTSELNEVRGKVGKQAAEMRNASAKVRIQNAMEQARTSIDPNEAEAFQQGDRLLFRLKGMNFTSGRAELPPKSLSLLSNIGSIVSELNPKEVIISGHTDSTGSAKINERLSKERAEAVAEYFKTSGLEDSVEVQSVGHGFKKPIASNKTVEGRAQNRRVDIEVLPAETGENVDVEMRRANDPANSETY